MLPYMKFSNTLWTRVVLGCLSLGLAAGSWAGPAAAQTDDRGGWFDDSVPSESAPPPEAVPSEPDYSPPPPDFQSEAPAAAAPEGPAEDDPGAQNRAVEEFSPRLAPYGRWVDDPWYGRVWVPSRSVVGSEFVPYSTGGHWELTPDDAWLWASDYPFGSITFHYGRWVWASPGYWAWVPGYVYAPAWVHFRVGAAGYIGWSPLPAYWVWRQGVFLSVGVWRRAPAIYCPTRYVFQRALPRYVVRDPVRIRSIDAQTRVYRAPRYVGRGPSPSEARIPRASLPERRVLAQPRLSLDGASRARLESSSRFTSNRSARPAPPGRSYSTRSRTDSAAPRVYTAPRHTPPEQRPAVRRSAPARSVWPQPPPSRNERSVSPRMQIDRRAPAAAAPRERQGYEASPYGQERSAAPRAAPAPSDSRASPRRSRRGDTTDRDAKDSRTRPRERYGSGR